MLTWQGLLRSYKALETSTVATDESSAHPSRLYFQGYTYVMVNDVKTIHLVYQPQRGFSSWLFIVSSCPSMSFFGNRRKNLPTIIARVPFFPILDSGDMSVGKAFVSKLSSPFIHFPSPFQAFNQRVWIGELFRFVYSVDSWEHGQFLSSITCLSNSQVSQWNPKSSSNHPFG